jgi:hypothetical protein
MWRRFQSGAFSLDSRSRVHILDSRIMDQACAPSFLWEFRRKLPWTIDGPRLARGEPAYLYVKQLSRAQSRADDGSVAILAIERVKRRGPVLQRGTFELAVSLALPKTLTGLVSFLH